MFSGFFYVLPKHTLYFRPFNFKESFDSIEQEYKHTVTLYFAYTCNGCRIGDPDQYSQYSKSNWQYICPVNSISFIFSIVSFCIIIPLILFARLSHLRCFCSAGKGVYGFLTVGQGQALRVMKKISTPAGSIFCTNLDSPKAYTHCCPRNKNDRCDDEA